MNKFSDNIFILYKCGNNNLQVKKNCFCCALLMSTDDKLTPIQEKRKKNHLLPEQREKLFALHSPIKKNDSDDDSDDDLYDESGDDSTGEGWGSDSETTEDLTPRDKKTKSRSSSKSPRSKKSLETTNITKTTESISSSHESSSSNKEIIDEDVDTDDDDDDADEFEKEESETEEKQEKKEIKLPAPTIIVQEETKKEEKEKSTKTQKKQEENIGAVDEAYKQSDLFQELLQFKNRTPTHSRSSSEVNTPITETPPKKEEEEEEEEKKRLPAHAVKTNESDSDMKSLKNSRQRSGKDKLTPIPDNIVLRPPVPRKDRSAKTRSVDVFRDSQEETQKRYSLLTEKIPNEAEDIKSPKPNASRNFESELCIDGAPVTPGADYFYSDADLNLLKEMEAREAMKQAFMASVTDEKEKQKQTDIKRKLKVASDLLNMLKNEDKDKEQPFDFAERNAQILAAQKTREKNRTANLLPEDTSLDPTIRLRNMTINEIVSTERDFKVDLETIVQVFYEPLVSSTIIDAQQCTSIFSNISVIYDICNTTVAKLEKTIHLPEGPKISDCFSELVSKKT